MCTIKYILERDLTITEKRLNKTRTGKRYRNVLNSLTRPGNARTRGKENYKCSLSFSNSNPITLTFPILFLGHPAHNLQLLLAPPLAFNQRIGSSYVGSNPSPAYGRLSFSTSILNGSTLMWQEKTPMTGLLDLSQMIV